MPVIPTLRQNQRLSQGGVSGFQNASDHRSMGEHLQLLGKTVSAVADGLHREYKEDTHLRTLWEDRARSAAQDKSREYVSNVQATASTENDGSKVEELYKKEHEANKAKFIETVPSQFKEYAKITYDTSVFTNSTDMYKETVKLKENFKIAATAKATDSVINSVNVDPSKYEVARVEGYRNIQTATENGILSKEILNDNLKAFDKKLANAHISGFINKPTADMKEAYENHKASQEAIQAHSLSGNISPEEAIKKSESALNAYWTDTQRIMSRNEHIEKVKKEINETKQQAEIDNIHAEMVKNKSDPSKLNILKDQLLDKMNSGGLRYKMSEGFKAFTVADEFQDQAMSYEIATRVGKDPTMKHIDQLKNEVMFHANDKNMGLAKSEYWIKRLDDIKEGLKKNPNHAIELQAIHAYIKMVNHASPFEAMTDINGAAVKDANYMWFKASSLMAEKGLSPRDALNVLKVGAGQTKEATGRGNIPISDLTGSTLETLEDIKKEKDTIYQMEGLSSERRKNLFKFLKRIEDGINARKSLIERKVDHLADEPLAPSSGPQIPFRR